MRVIDSNLALYNIQIGEIKKIEGNVTINTPNNTVFDVTLYMDGIKFASNNGISLIEIFTPFIPSRSGIHVKMRVDLNATI